MLASRASASTPETNPVQFSIYFFANQDGEDAAPDKYRLMLEAGRWADANNFTRLWTPERHFHRFGGLSPNPSVIAAALAAVTTRIQLCAGSVVLPLHDPLRVAEEWAVVDNISNGRVGLGVACGWVPNDFVISGRQSSFDARHRIFAEGTDLLRKLWRGEPFETTNPQGEPVSIRTLPRPLQRELPIWITTAGNPETFRQAGALGANVLTHLLGQTTGALAEKVRLYREAWREAGHPGEGTVTLMLHTFVGDTDEEVHELAREPMKRYLGSSLTLAAKHLASVPFLQHPEHIDTGALTPELVDQTLEASFEKYFAMASMLGSIEKSMDVVQQFADVDVDEIACLIDFGIAEDRVLAALENLNVVRILSKEPALA